MQYEYAACIFEACNLFTRYLCLLCIYVYLAKVISDYILVVIKFKKKPMRKFLKPIIKWKCLFVLETLNLSLYLITLKTVSLKLTRNYFEEKTTVNNILSGKAETAKAEWGRIHHKVQNSWG